MSILSSVLRRKRAPPSASVTETSALRVIRHPLTREQAQERGAIGHQKRRERKMVEAIMMKALGEQAPTLGVILEVFPKFKKEVIWGKPELLEGLLKTFGPKAGPPEDNHDGDAIERRRRRERLEG